MFKESDGKDMNNQKTIERIIFLQGNEADEALNIYENEGLDAVLNFLIQWHYPGEHETASDFGNGTSDRVFDVNGYRVILNTGLGYVGLEFNQGGVE